MFEGFTLEYVEVGEVTLRVRHGALGRPVLLLHGHPRTHTTWHGATPLLAGWFFIVCPDLRGYRQSTMRYDDMPRPVLDLGEGRVKLWLRPDIERWAAEQAAGAVARAGVAPGITRSPGSRRLVRSSRKGAFDV